MYGWWTGSSLCVCVCVLCVYVWYVCGVCVCVCVCVCVLNTINSKITSNTETVSLRSILIGLDKFIVYKLSFRSLFNVPQM